ncbi:hypothetical protein STEG23_013915 [Scotinomys teguina]
MAWGLVVRDMNELSQHNSVQPSYGDWVTSGFVETEYEEISATSAGIIMSQKKLPYHYQTHDLSPQCLPKPVEL